MTEPPLTRKAVLTAVAEFDKLGRDRFLAKYNFAKATSFFLARKGRRYDAKAIVGAAYGFLGPRSRPLKWDDFGSREVTTKKWLEALDFPVIHQLRNGREIPSRSSARLTIGAVYTRDELKKRFSIRDANLYNGVFRPDGFHSVWLFVTEKKTPDRTQFQDLYRGDTLRWQGQSQGRTDPLIIDHRSLDLELLLFYRREKYEYPDAGFRYEGVFRYQSKRGSHPTSFILRRQSTRAPIDIAQDAADYGPAFDPKNVTDARKRTLTNIVARRGQSKFRNTLLRAYASRCAITACNCRDALEAAHIYDYRGPITHHVTNGLLLRADIHTLFDLGKIAIDPHTHRVIIDPSLRNTTYRKLEGKQLTLPRNPSERPSRKSLLQHFELSDAGKACASQ